MGRRGVRRPTVAAVGAANAYVVLSTSDEATDEVVDAPHAQVALVSGALVSADRPLDAVGEHVAHRPVRDAIVVTQGFHMPRALYLADRAGLDATGVTSELQPYGRQLARSEVREVASRVKAVADATLDSGVVLGPPVPITGDARASWGPEPPPGTPPSGAPR